MKKNLTLKLTESAIMIAIATVLSLIKVIDLPYGGSVTAFSMVPIIIIAYRHGIKWGLLSGLSYSIIQMLFGLNNLSYATSWKAAVAIIFLDYIFAFTLLGLAGAFRKLSPSLSLPLGAAFTCILRYICHVISGCTVWAGVSIPSVGGFVFSLGYNASYMIPETFITVIAAIYIAQTFSLSSDSVIRIKKAEKQSLFHPVSLLILLLTIIADTFIVYLKINTANGFDISGLKNVNYIIVVLVLLVGVVLSLATNSILKKNKNKK